MCKHVDEIDARVGGFNKDATMARWLDGARIPLSTLLYAFDKLEILPIESLRKILDYCQNQI